tara:strand:- start:11111 stop:12607 length:1497 start_codon:yes stop_codon:yes gene_type:complete
VKLKLLLWIDGPLYFSMAYHLQQMIDCDIYAIIDVTNQPKNFYIDQKLVKFKKIWFFHDNIKNIHTPDIEYLASFEKKYDIDIWKIAINERLFYNYYNYYKFSSEEILSIEEDCCKLFENIFDNVQPDIVLAYTPNHHHSELFYKFVQAKQIRILILSNPMIGYKSRISENREILDTHENFKMIDGSNRDFSEMREYRNKHDVAKQIKISLENEGYSKSKLIKALIKFIFSNNSHIKTHYTYFGRTKFAVLKNSFINNFKIKSREKFMQRNLLHDVDLQRPFVYFPLGAEPESNILLGAPLFTNQIEMIRTIVKSLPINYQLYVKENPGQVDREWRSISTYKEIQNIPNVKLIHPSFSNVKLLENSSVVITLAGSSGFEAACYEKPSIVFSDALYTMLPSVHRIKEIEKLPELIRQCLEEKVNPNDLDKFLHILEKNTFDFDLRGLNTKIKNHFYYGGYLVDTEITEIQMKSFLKDNEIPLKQLVDEHIKKIRIGNEN